jgi:hypothetical protein
MKQTKNHFYIKTKYRHLKRILHHQLDIINFHFMIENKHNMKEIFKDIFQNKITV